MNTLPVQSLPFVVEPVSSRRIQLWAWFAGQASTKEGFDIVSNAFYALWFEVALYETYQQFFSDQEAYALQCPPIHVLDSLLCEALTVMNAWSGVTRSLERDFLRIDPAWHDDASDQFLITTQRIYQLVPFIVSLCQSYHLDLPKETRQYLSQQQQQLA